MTIADFLSQAGFWQWVGMIFLAAVISNFRLFTIIRKKVTKSKEDK